MTTRETTAFLALDDLDLTLSLSDRFMVMAYGAIQWPWLLRSLDGGRKKDKAKLLAYLDLPLDALPNLGSWKADTHFLWHIVSAIEEMRPQQVVELGCGASTFVAARALQLFGGGKIVSFDQHGDFASTTQDWIRDNNMDVDIRHAPLGPPPAGWPARPPKWATPSPASSRRATAPAGTWRRSSPANCTASCQCRSWPNG